jgi:GT2 family glycosyltransferase/lipopolysaccharide/colanic/teichoic acid biosynthesis glycosyltransferase
LAEISVIIVNYNVKELLENCINSIFAASKNIETEIIVVDNNSYDGSAEYLKSKFCSKPNVKIIESKINLGFAKANNLGATQAAGKYLLILNPDTILQEDTLEKTLSFYKSDPKTGAVTCKLVLPNGKLDLACRRSFPSPSVAIYRIIGLSKLFPGNKLFGRYNLTYLNENETYEVDAVCGAFMMIEKATYDKVGGFDEDYFMYGEDLDLCYKIKQAGYKIFYYSGTSIIHFKGESTKKSSISYVNNFYGAMRIFVEKNLHKKFALLNAVIKILIFYRALISYISRFLKAFYPALLDGMMIVGAMLFSIYLRFEFFPLEAYTLVIIIYTVIWLLALSITGSYKRENKLSLVTPLYGILFGFFINSSFTYFFNEFAFSRIVVLRTTAYSYLFLIAWRFISKLYTFSTEKNIFYNNENAILIGKNKESELFAAKAKKRVDSRYNIIGSVSASTEYGSGYLGNLDNLNDIVSARNIRHLIFVSDVLTNQQILTIMWNLRNSNLSFKILSTDSDLLLGKNALDKVDDIYLMQIEYNINKKFNIFVKRLFDIVFGVFCIIFVYPFVLLFNKFSGFHFIKQKFLSKLLFIPQVISGKYSFVGRAIWDTASHGKNFLGKNGLTGLVQVNFYKNLSGEEIEYYNNYYAKNQSLKLDIEIIIKTISLFLFRKKILHNE